MGAGPLPAIHTYGEPFPSSRGLGRCSSEDGGRLGARQWITDTLLDLSEFTFLDPRATQIWCPPSEGAVSLLCVFYGVTKRKADPETSGKSVHRISYNMPVPVIHFFRMLWCFQGFEQPLFILCYIFTAFSYSWSVNHNYLMLPWHQPSELGNISILPEEDTSLKSLPFSRIRSGFLSAAAWLSQRYLWPNKLTPLLLPSRAALPCPSSLWPRCFLDRWTPVLFFHVTPWPNQRKHSESLKINKRLTRKKKQKGRRNIAGLEDLGAQPMYRWYLTFSKHQVLVSRPGFLWLFPGHFELTYQIE